MMTDFSHINFTPNFYIVCVLLVSVLYMANRTNRTKAVSIKY